MRYHTRTVSTVKSSFELTLGRLAELFRVEVSSSDKDLVEISLEELEHVLQPLAPGEPVVKCKAWTVVARSGDREVWRHEGPIRNPRPIPPASYRASDLGRRCQEMVAFVTRDGAELRPREIVQVTLSGANLSIRLRGRTWTVTAVS